MSARGWTNATTALRLAVTGALLWSCSSDTHTPSGLSHEATGKTSQALNTNPTIGNFVLYAERSIKLGAFDQVTGGDVGVAATAVSSFGPQLVVGDHVQVDTANSLLSPSTTLGSKAQVGDVQTTSLQNNGAKSVGTVAPYPASAMPPVPVAGSNGGSGSDVTIASHQNTSLSPGSYGALSIADHCNVMLGQGTYSFTSVSVSEHVQLASDPAGVTLLVSGAFAVAGWDLIGPASGATADKLTILVAGMDGPSGSPPAASIGLHSQLAGLMAVPHGTLAIADHVQATGAFAGFDVSVSNHTQTTLQTGFSVTTPGQHGTQQLTGYVPVPVMANAPVVGPMPPDASVMIAIGLPIAHPAQLQDFIKQLADPSSSQFRQWISADDFATRFGPSANDYNALVGFAHAHGMTIDRQYPNRLLLTTIASVATIEAAFYVNINTFLRFDGTPFYAPTNEPSLDLSTTIHRITGLDNAFPGAPSGGSGTGPAAGRFQGLDFRNAYLGGPPCTGYYGDGQNIVLYAQDQFSASDITSYIANAGLGSLTDGSNVQPYEEICNVTGSAGCWPGTDGNSRTEVAGDIEVALSMAPHAKILMYENGNYDAGFARFLEDLANYPLGFVHQASDSWIDGWDGNHDNAMQAIATHGVTLFYAAGDTGAFSGQQGFGTFGYAVPGSLRGFASNFGSTIVGGTILKMNGPGQTWASETVWSQGPTPGNPNVAFAAGNGGIFDGANSFQLAQNGGLYTSLGSPGYGLRGGVCFQYQGHCDDVYGDSVPIPYYQQLFIPSTTNEVSFTNANAPDVSGVANGVAVFVNGSYTPNPVGGTSMSAPMWAGFMALVFEDRANAPVPGGPYWTGWITPTLYQILSKPSLYQATFHDVISGSNKFTYQGTQLNGFVAQPGYDLASGIGTPTCTLLQQLAAPNPIVPNCPSGQNECLGTDCCPTGQCQVGFEQVGPVLLPTNVCCPTTAQLCGPNAPAVSAETNNCCGSGGSGALGSTCLPFGFGINATSTCCPNQAVNGGACCGNDSWIVCDLSSTTGTGNCCQGTCRDDGMGGGPQSGDCCQASQNLFACGSVCCSTNQPCLSPGICGTACATAAEVCPADPSGCCPPTNSMGEPMKCCGSLGCVGTGSACTG